MSRPRRRRARAHACGGAQAAVALAITLAIGGCFAVGVPPGRLETGGIAAADASGAGAGYRLSAGAHYGSATRRIAVPIDLGTGYVYEKRSTGAQHATYLELGRSVRAGGDSRGWVSGRFERFWTDADDGAAFAASVRAAWERTATTGVYGGDRGVGGAVYGTWAIGVYAEAGYRHSADGAPGAGIAAGVCVRFPLIGMIAAGR